MKYFTKKLLIVLAIVMSLASMPAFGEDADGPYGTKKENISEVMIKSGCVISIREFNIDYITLCTDPEIEDCSQCDECDDEHQKTILGIGPEWYWEEACIVELEKDENVDPYVCEDPAVKVALPGLKEFVTIGTITNSVGDFVAVWVQTEALMNVDDDKAVLLRNPYDDFETMWQGTGKEKE